MWILWRILVACWKPEVQHFFGIHSSQVLVEASDLNAVQFCRKELKNQEVADDEMQAGPGGQDPPGWHQDWYDWVS